MNAVASLWRRYRRNRAAVGGLLVIGLIIMTAAVGPSLYDVDPFDMLGRPSTVPSNRFPLGTDVSGRDILAGLLHGARVSLLISASVPPLPRPIRQHPGCPRLDGCRHRRNRGF